MSKIFLFILISFPIQASDLLNKKYNLNLNQTNLTDVVEMIADNAHLKLKMSSSSDQLISLQLNHVTLKGALDRLSREYGITYKIKGDTLYIGSRSPASVSSSSTDSQIIQRGNATFIKLKYVAVSDVASKLNTLLGKDEKLIVDKPTNSIAIFGSSTTASRIRSYVEVLDKLPTQVLIEAQIVEVNKNKAREFGIQWGDLNNPDLATIDNTTGIISPNQPDNPVLQIGAKIGKVGARDLLARIALAESEGDAETISRPNIVTINNMPAKIDSGAELNIRTLSSVNSSDSESSDVSGGIQTISAGLNVSVTPTVLGDGKIKLQVSVSNREVDESTSVLGIPGISNNSAQTSIIVNNGQTASLAGLVRKTKSESETGVPFLSKIPILGWFFKSQSKQKRDRELLIFITPKIVAMNDLSKKE